MSAIINRSSNAEVEKSEWPLSSSRLSAAPLPPPRGPVAALGQRGHSGARAASSSAGDCPFRPSIRHPPPPRTQRSPAGPPTRRLFFAQLQRDPQIKAHLRRYLSTAADRNLPVAHNHNANTSPNLNSNSSSLSSGSASGPSWRSSQSSPTATDSSPPSRARSRQSAASAGSGEALLGGTEDDVWQPHRIPPKQPKFEAYMMTGELMLNLSSAERSSELQAYQNSYQSHSLQGHHPHHHHHAPRHRHAQRYNSTPASPNESRLPNNTVREVQRYNSTPATTALGTSRRGSDSSDHEQQGYAFNSTPASPASENNVSPSHLPHSSQNGQHCQVGNRVPPQACVRTSRSEDHLQKEWSLSTVAVDMDEDVTSSLNTLLDTREPADIATNMPTNTSRIAPSPPGSTREHLLHTGPNSPSETGPERIVWTYNAPVSSASERITSHYNGSSSTTATSNSTSISDGISPQRSMSPASPTSMSSSVMSSASVSRRTPPPAAMSDSRNITNVGVGTDTQRNSIVSQHHRFNGDASVSEAMSSVSSPDYQDLLERSELLDERNRMQLSDASDSDSTILASEPAHQHRIVIQVKGASAGGDGCGSLETHVNGSGVMKVLQNGNGNMDNPANTPEAHGYQELKSDDILNTILIDSVSDEGSDVDSLHSFHYSPKAVDIPSAVRLAKRLYHLDGFKKSDVSRHLSKNNDFAKAVAEEYVRHFDFQKQGLDSALRLFLARFALTGETQERERVLVHFSRRYLDCNPGSFSSQDAVHTLTCAIMLLNTDLHGLGAGNGAASGPAFRRMSCAEFIDNLTGLNDGGDFPKDVLKRLYHAIKNKPLQWAIDGEGGSDNEEAKAGVSMSNNGGTNGNGTSAPPVAQSNPFLDVPDQSRAIEYKKGYVMRKSCKEANGKRTPFGKRSWKMFYCTLRDLVLYLHKDEHGFRKPQMSDDLYNAIRIHHALATKANDYTKKQHVFRLQTADQAEYLFQTSDSKELNSWVDTVNFVCAAFSAQPLAGAVGSQRKFQRPLLPCSHTKLSLRDQLRDHEDRCASLEAELHAIRSSPGMNAPYHKDKEGYLQFELKRYKTYAQCLKWRWSEERGVQPPPLPERPPPRAPEAPAPAP